MEAIAGSHSSDAEFNAALARQFLDRNMLRQRLEQDLTIAKYISSLSEAITVTPEEISKYYADNPAMFAHPDIIRASHILLRFEGTPDLEDKVRERAESLLARVKQGEDFAALARENSEDASATEGGDIGYAARNALETNFADAVFSMSVDEIRLVRSRFGYHIVKLTDKKLEGIAPLDEIREDLAGIMRQEKAQAELARIINQLQEQANIEILISPGE
jgi:peptidyl-prolyl cis-trans isomerase C